MEARRPSTRKYGLLLAPLLALVMTLGQAVPASAAYDSWAPGPGSGGTAKTGWYADYRFALAQGYRSREGLRAAVASLAAPLVKTSHLESNIDLEINRFGGSYAWQACAAEQLSWAAYNIATADKKISDMQRYLKVMTTASKVFKAPKSVASAVSEIAKAVDIADKINASANPYQEMKLAYGNIMECA